MRQVLTMAKLPRVIALYGIVWLSISLLLLSASSAFALIAEDGLVIGDEYEYEQRGGTPIPEKKLTPQQIDAAEA